MSLPTEFDKTGVTYYAVAPEGYVYSTEQTAQYGTRKYTTLAACAAAMPYTPTTPFVINILGSWSTALGTSTWTGSAFTATNYLLIRCIGNARHNGVYSTTAARVSVTSGYGLQNYNPYTTIEGLQFVAGTPTADIYMVGIYSASSNVLDSCIIKGPGGTPGYYMWGVEVGQAGITVKNCVIYDWVTSIGGGAGIAPEYAANYYNNTIRNCEYGFYSYVSSGVATNNVVQDCASGCYYGTSAFTGSNNVADDSTAPGTAKITGEVAFEGETTGNFQLASGDTVARGRGVTLAAVDDDITGTARTIHSCGAFEGAAGGTSENAVTESESPARPVSSQEVTQPSVVTSTESPALAVETSAASQANTVASTESPTLPTSTQAVTQPNVVVSTEVPVRPTETEASLVGNTVASSVSPSSPTEIEAVTQPFDVASTDAATAPAETENVLPGNIVTGSESPASPVENSTATQQTTVSSIEFSSVLTELETVLFGTTIASTESSQSPTETEAATQPVVVVSTELNATPSEFSTATQGTAILSTEQPALPFSSESVAQPFEVASTEAPTSPVELSTATETWSVASSELSGEPPESQTVEQFWFAASSETPVSPNESETVELAYLISSSETGRADENQAVQQPFTVVSIETPSGAIELSRAYRPNQTLGGSVSIAMLERHKISFKITELGSTSLTLIERCSVSLKLN